MAAEDVRRGVEVELEVRSDRRGFEGGTVDRAGVIVTCPPIISSYRQPSLDFKDITPPFGASKAIHRRSASINRSPHSLLIFLISSSSTMIFRPITFCALMSVE